jgi:hypothetical protein
MWTLALGAALAAPDAPAPAADPATLPWRVGDPAWDVTDRRATRLARGAAWVAGIGGVATAAGAGLEALSDGDAGSVGVVVGSAGAVAGLTAPAIALGASLRANRSLRERGVHVSPAAAIAGWTLFATGTFAIPAFVVAGVTEDEEGFFVVAAAWYASLVALPLTQLEVDRRGREAAGLAPIAARERALPVLAVVPTGRGLALAGAF